MDASEAAEGHCLYHAGQLQAVLDSMAAQAACLLAGKPAPVLLGILRRGGPLAESLHARLASQVPGLRLETLRVQRYGDDLSLQFPETPLSQDQNRATPDFGGCTVLVVDDVLYQGYSMVRTIGWLVDRGALEIRTAVLVDRCATLLPVRPDITGLKLQVAPGSIIACHVPPYEPELSIRLLTTEND